jgi:ABC-type branched-subunit amino acid transport system ATPase component
VLKPDSGTISFAGEDVTSQSQAARVRKGLVRTFQLTTLAQHLPVQRQIELALFERENITPHFWKSIDSYSALTEEALSILEALGLREFAALPTENLAYGEQRLVEVGLALALNPKVLLLDEPMAGVPRGEGARMLDALNKLSKDLGILIIEHDMDLVFSFAQRIIVLSEGEVIAVGTPDEIRNDQKVKSVYLGS